MSHRISQSTLYSRVRTINELTGNHVTPYSVNQESNEIHANVGNYHLGIQAVGDRYGTRYTLLQMTNEGGGCRTIIPTVCGAANFLDSLNAFISGIEIGKKLHVSELTA